MTMLEDISLEEKHAVEELKRRTIQDVTADMLEDPYLFYRFTKARDYNVKNAEAMLRKHIAWRKEFNVANILTDYKPPEVLKKYVPSSFIGFDLEGCPIRYISVSGADSKGLFKSAKKSDMIKFNIHLLEQDVQLLKEQSKKLGKPVTKMLYIYDFNKLSFSKATDKNSLDMAMTGISLYQDNYPERIKSIYVINASTYFTITYSIVKTVCAAAVIEKVQVFGTEGWKEALLKVIDADVLPAFLGGNRTDPDGNPLCKTFVVHGDTVPEEFYFSKSKRNFYQEPGVKKLQVTQFSSAKLTFDVEKPGSLLEWEFETKSRDIGFGVIFKEKSFQESKLVELVPKQRIDTDLMPETGMYKCEKVGLYIIVFDNSYSWIYPKEIYYRARIIPPNE